MAVVDETKVVQLTSELRGAVTNLNELAAMPRTELLADKHLLSSAKYNLIVAIEAAIDLSGHAISRMGLRGAEDYADTFRVLGENGAFSDELLETLVEMAKFRNRLVHFYFRIDDETVVRILGENLGDFEAFLQAYGAFIQNSG